MDENASTRTSDQPESDRQSLVLDTDFQIVAEDAPVMLWLTNAEGKVVFTNSKWMKFVGGTSTQRVGGDAWIKALHPDDLEPCLRIFEEAFGAHKSFEMEYRLRRADGQYRYVLDTGEPYISKDGKFAGFIGASTDITDRKNHENQLRVSQLELTQHNLEMQLINELNSYLQVCRSLEETHSIVAHFARRIFAEYAGALYLFNENHSRVESVAQWGDAECFSVEAISPDDCWALRQGKVHVVDGSTDVIVCKHIAEGSRQGYVCAPAIAQGEMIGVLSVTLGRGDGDGGDGAGLMRRSVESRSRLISMAADNLAMALVSLKLREALRERSVRDPLTRLFNRRYLEETLARELSNCKRAGKPLGVIMVDIDHFKQYNDTHGHDVGDFVLVEIADLVRSKLRSEDVACRYGGEELALIMHGASKEIVFARAEAVRKAIADHEFVCKGKNLARVTVSMGVAEFPADGDSVAAVLKAADTALYQAKESGRNRTAMAGIT
ncbi:MAG: diguanylate cyclase [Betaproteobacteria bacterium]|nr:diguanylate cyclase [Betaproteobacteria bacterium]